jgi:hypothetical protein
MAHYGGGGPRPPHNGPNGQLQYLIGSFRCNDTTGHIIRMMLDYKKLECGCIDNVLEQEYDRYYGTIIDKNWITEIWAQLSLHNAKVQVK